MPAATSFDVLLLDFGGVCLLNPVERHAQTELDLGLEPGTLSWLGPLAPSTDELWRRMIAGELTERDYWEQRSAELGRLCGRELSTRDYMTLVYEPPRPGLVRPEAVVIVERALAAGCGVSVLTNDMRAFHGEQWEQGIELLSLVDHVVDLSDSDFLKPDARAFELAEAVIGVSLGRMLFVDDQPRNVEGARAVGLEAMWFDIAHAADSWAAVGDRLGI